MAAPAASPAAPARPDTAGRLTLLGAAVAAVALCYARPLLELSRFAAAHELYSYVLLVPLISLFMVWSRRGELPAPARPDVPWALALAGLGAALLVAGRSPLTAGDPTDRLILALLSFVCLVAACCAWFLGRPLLRATAYPLAFLILLAPFPEQFSAGLEHALQHASASLAYAFLDGAGMPVYSANDLSLQLPGITLEVAPECSGLRSTVALFVVSLPAGYVFLRSWWGRLLVALAVVPLGVFRNAFRIFTIAELCVHIGPQMIDSYIHRHGGWIFFLVSLVPFFLLIVGLARLERRRGHPPLSRA